MPLINFKRTSFFTVHMMFCLQSLPELQFVLFVRAGGFFCLCRKPTVVTKYVGSDDEQIVDETVNEDISNENSENDVDMQSLPKGRSCLFLVGLFVSEFSKLVKIMMHHK